MIIIVNVITNVALQNMFGIYVMIIIMNVIMNITLQIMMVVK